MKVAVSWIVMPCSSEGAWLSRRNILSPFSGSKCKRHAELSLSHVSAHFMLGLILDPEDDANMFL
jgi:hypothetical protein